MIDPAFRNINIVFVISFKNGDNDPRRDSFDKILHVTGINERF